MPHRVPGPYGLIREMRGKCVGNAYELRGRAKVREFLPIHLSLGVSPGFIFLRMASTSTLSEAAAPRVVLLISS